MMPPSMISYSSCQTQKPRPNPLIPTYFFLLLLFRYRLLALLKDEILVWGRRLESPQVRGDCLQPACYICPSVFCPNLGAALWAGEPDTTRPLDHPTSPFALIQFHRFDDSSVAHPLLDKAPPPPGIPFPMAQRWFFLPFPRRSSQNSSSSAIGSPAAGNHSMSRDSNPES